MEEDMSKELSQLRAHLSKSNNGTAILFTGAGFSFGALNIKGQMPKDSRSLSRAICSISGISEDEDLYYSSEYCIANTPNHRLVDLLKSEYTINTVSDSHRIIASKNWRRIYTTNYDHVYEISSNDVSKVCESINISKAPSSFNQKNQCVHLNGSIEDLTNDTLQDDFKLSDSSYVTPDTLNRSKWKNTFAIDIENASAVYFVGYSMYDLDIKRILKKDIDIRSKTFFIVKPNEDFKEKFKLERYGTVLDIGVDGFAKLVGEIVSDDYLSKSEDLEFFEKIRILERDKKPSDVDTRNLFLSGILFESEIFPSIQEDSLHLFKRDDIEKSASLIEDGQNLIIVGGIASGKSIYAKQIATLLCQQGRDVFAISNEEGDYKRDIKIIDEICDSPIFFLDNAFRHEDTIIDLFTIFGNRARFILAGRAEFLPRTKIALKKVDFSFVEENVEYLSNDEIARLNSICDDIGYWGLRNSWSSWKKERYLKEDCEGRMATILLKYFNSDYVRNIFEEKLSALKEKSGKEREIVFIVTLLGLLPFSPRKALVSDLCGNDYIYSPEFSSSPITQLLFNFKGRHIEISSGILSKLVLDKFFSGREILEKAISIIAHFETIKNESSINKSIFKELLRFKNINAMLPDKNRPANLNTFFNRLKATVSWLKYSPHFWLQYGMASMFLEDYATAREYFDNSYGSAKNDPTYDTKYIDNQMARWHLDYGVTKEHSKEAFEHLHQAYKLLLGQEVDYYFCKHTHQFSKYYEEYYENFSKKNKADFEKICKNMLTIVERENQNELYIPESKSIFETILADIKIRRATKKSVC